MHSRHPFFILVLLQTKLINRQCYNMGKGKLAKFADMETFSNVYQYPFSVVGNDVCPMQGHWKERCFWQ